MKWSIKKDILNKKLIFIPIQKGIHWTLCVIINPGKIKNNTTSNKPNSEITHVLLFNSLWSKSISTGKKDVFINIKRWLNCTYKNKHPDEFKDKNCTIFDNIKMYHPTGK